MPGEVKGKKQKAQKPKPRVKKCPPAYAEGAEGGPTAKPKKRRKRD
jgi:hypothetical protein